MIETVDVDLVAKGVAALVAALEQSIFVRLHIVIAVKVGVGADADMMDPDQLRDIVDMVGLMPDLGRFGRADEHADAGYALSPALPLQPLARPLCLYPPIFP